MKQLFDLHPRHAALGIDLDLYVSAQMLDAGRIVAMPHGMAPRLATNSFAGRLAGRGCGSCDPQRQHQKR